MTATRLVATIRFAAVTGIPSTKPYSRQRLRGVVAERRETYRSND
jgi:hypothetical protein